MRRVLFTVLFVAVPLAAQALPLLSVPAERSVTSVQNRFLPGFLGGGGGNGSRSDSADPSVRIDQLESQVRMLTGQVEQLTFSVRRLESALQQERRARTAQEAALRKLWADVAALTAALASVDPSREAPGADGRLGRG